MLVSSLFRLIGPRLIFAGIFLLCSIGLAYALYAQYFNGAEPCPLCIAQRVFYAVIGLIAGIALIHKPHRWGNLVYALLITIVSLFALKIAHHHVWLQSLPPAEWPASCGMPLEVLYQRIPLSGFLKVILAGTAECASIEWKIFGLPAPLVSMWGFATVTIGSVCIMLYSLIQRQKT